MDKYSIKLLLCDWLPHSFGSIENFSNPTHFQIGMHLSHLIWWIELMHNWRYSEIKITKTNKMRIELKKKNQCVHEQFISFVIKRLPNKIYRELPCRHHYLKLKNKKMRRKICPFLIFTSGYFQIIFAIELLIFQIQ